MVSRRKILSRSRDELSNQRSNTSNGGAWKNNEDSDVWYSKEKMFQDHIDEVRLKWNSIDDEIWAKIIVLERNRRVAKAYARAPVLTINGSDDGFDGFRIGVAGFDNPMRDPATYQVIRNIGQGFKLKMDDTGNILIKRLSKSSIRVRNTVEESAVSNDVLKLQNGLLEMDKPFKVFDMKKFQQNIGRELKRPYPDKRKLESQCINVVSFTPPSNASGGGLGESSNNPSSKSENENILSAPIWILIINIVGLEMLRSKLPPLSQNRSRHRSIDSSVQNEELSKQNKMEEDYAMKGHFSLGYQNPHHQHHLLMQRDRDHGHRVVVDGNNNTPSALRKAAGHKVNHMSSSGEEDPYSIASSLGGIPPHVRRSSGALNRVSQLRAAMSGQAGHRSRGGGVDRPPKLPPRYYDQSLGNGVHEQGDEDAIEYADDYDENPYAVRGRLFERQRQRQDAGITDDPYYCGFKARVPNFVHMRQQQQQQQNENSNSNINHLNSAMEKVNVSSDINTHEIGHTTIDKDQTSSSNSSNSCTSSSKSSDSSDEKSGGGLTNKPRDRLSNHHSSETSTDDQASGGSSSTEETTSNTDDSTYSLQNKSSSNKLLNASTSPPQQPTSSSSSTVIAAAKAKLVNSKSYNLFTKKKNSEPSKYGTSEVDGMKAMSARRMSASAYNNSSHPTGGGGGPSSLPPQMAHNPMFWWQQQSRMFNELNGMNMEHMMNRHHMQQSMYCLKSNNLMPYVTDSSDSDYSYIYGKLPFMRNHHQGGGGHRGHHSHMPHHHSPQTPSLHPMGGSGGHGYAPPTPHFHHPARHPHPAYFNPHHPQKGRSSHLDRFAAAAAWAAAGNQGGGRINMGASTPHLGKSSPTEQMSNNRQGSKTSMFRAR